MSDKTVLLVDDSRVARMMTAAMIERVRPGWRIVEAASGEAALIAAQGLPPDFVLLDVNMPGMGGLAAAERLRAEIPAARISLLTANIQDPVRRRAEEIGVGFLVKPLREADLRQFLECGQAPS